MSIIMRRASSQGAGYDSTGGSGAQLPRQVGSVRPIAEILVGAGQRNIGTSHCSLAASRGRHYPAWGFSTELLAESGSLQKARILAYFLRPGISAKLRTLP